MRKVLVPSFSIASVPILIVVSQSFVIQSSVI